MEYPRHPSAASSTLVELTTRLDFFKERRSQLMEQLHNLDLNYGTTSTQDLIYRPTSPPWNWLTGDDVSLTRWEEVWLTSCCISFDPIRYICILCSPNVVLFNVHVLYLNLFFLPPFTFWENVIGFWMRKFFPSVLLVIHFFSYGFGS